MYTRRYTVWRGLFPSLVFWYLITDVFALCYLVSYVQFTLSPRVSMESASVREKRPPWSLEIVSSTFWFMDFKSKNIGNKTTVCIAHHKTLTLAGPMTPVLYLSMESIDVSLTSHHLGITFYKSTCDKSLYCKIW